MPLAKLDGKQIDRLKKQHSTEPCLSPLTGDGIRAAAVIDEIQRQIGGLEIGQYHDLLAAFRQQLREARYQDWLAAQGRHG